MTKKKVINDIPEETGKKKMQSGHENGSKKRNSSKKKSDTRIEKKSKDRTREELLTEITALKRKNKKLASELDKVEKLYWLLADNISDNIWILELETMRFSYTSPSTVHFLGYTEKEILEIKPEEITVPSSMEKTLKILGEEFEKDNVKGVELNRSRIIEVEQIHKDGHIVYVEMMTSFLRDKKGKPTAVLGVSRDRSEIRKSQEKLKESEKRFKQLSQASFEGIAVHDQGIILEANDALANMFGYKLDEFIGINVVTLTAPESLEFLLEKIRQGYQKPYEVIGLRKDGSRFHVELIGKDIQYNEKTARVAAIRDITDRKILEEKLLQSRKLESIGRLAGGVAHDLNNLLTPIMGYAEMILLELSDQSPCHDDALQIREATVRAQNISRQLLAFSRKQILDMRILNLGQVVSEFEPILQRTVREDIELKIRIDPLTGNVRSDSSQIEQIMLNLVINSQDAMPDGGKIFIEVVNTDLDESTAAGLSEITPGAYVMLTVTDTGHGMDKQTMELIYEPFFTTREYGTGLGLATVYGIIKQHDGSINVESYHGKGTVFSIYFPQVSEELEKSADSEREKIGAPQGETILVVEDEEAVRKLTFKILKKQGYKVIQARDADEAIQIVKERTEAINLLLTDVILPRIDGKKLYQKISSMQSNVKVLYMSGYSHNLIAHRGIVEDGINFIQKPFSMQSLTDKVRRVLDE